MKRYDSITSIKAISCIIVFTTHWIGPFKGLGIWKIDRLLDWGIFRFLNYGTMAVYVFLILSGISMSLKIYSGGSCNWTRELLKRYIRLAIPIFVTSLCAWFLLHYGLFFTQQVAAKLNDGWLSPYYVSPLSVKDLLITSFITCIATGDWRFYNPLWMIRYIFFGAVFALVISEVYNGLNRFGRVLMIVSGIIVFTIVDSYYFCFFIGSLLAYYLKQSEKLSVSNNCQCSIFRGGMIGLSLVSIIFGLWIALNSASIVALPVMQSCVDWAVNGTKYWMILASTLIVAGIIFLWEFIGDVESVYLNRLTQVILWIGERSYAIFMVHWIVLCSFSCWFYLQFYDYGPKIANTLNFLISSIIVLIMALIYHCLVEEWLCKKVWRKVEKIVMKGQK